MSIRNIPDDDLAALKRIATRNNRSAEAEVRQAIADLVRAKSGKGFGSYLHEHYGGVLDDEPAFQREQTPAEPMAFD